MLSHVNLTPVQEKLLASQRPRLCSRGMLRRPLEPTTANFKTGHWHHRLVPDDPKKKSPRLVKGQRLERLDGFMVRPFADRAPILRCRVKSARKKCRLGLWA